MKRIKMIKEVEIMSNVFKITWDKNFDGWSFCWGDSNITIGIKSYRQDYLYTLNILSHEVMEAILMIIGARYQNSRESDYLFSFNHQAFETAVSIHTQVMNKFIL